MKEELSFQIDAAIIHRLGRELVAKQETALIELIKNGYDADATSVEVVFQESGDGPVSLEIRDNGNGMTRDELIDGFLRLASNLKVQRPHSPKFHRRRAGRKGIGRFSTQRLGDRLVLTTCPSGASAGLELTVNWQKFVGGQSLENVTVELQDKPCERQGTTLRIELLRDNWTRAQIRNCWRGVLALQQPFPVAPVENKSSADPGFEVKFLQSGGLFEDESIVADMQTEILDYLHAEIELEVDHEGFARWRITKNRLGPDQDWKPINHNFRHVSEPPPYYSLRQAAMKTYYAILLPSLLPSLVYTRVRDVLAEEGGVRLYRNGFRVVPYGEPGNDWLRLDETYSKRAVLSPVANRNFFGVVQLNDPEGTAFEEHTSREGLIETLAFLELQGLVSSVLITAATQIASDRGRKTHAGGRTAPKVPQIASSLDEVSAAAKATKDAADRVSRGASAAEAAVVAERAAETLKLIQETQSQIEEQKAEMADEAAMLRFLATLGMTTAEFTHETGMTFDAFRFDFQQVFDVAEKEAELNPKFKAQSRRARSMLDRLETLTSYLNALAAARSLRGMNPVSLSKSVEDFRRGLLAQANSQSVSLTIETPPFDPLFTRPMHQAEIASILLNFYTNAVKAMKRSNSARQVLIVADRIEDMVRLRFSDTGDGIPVSNVDKIFDAFFTTTNAPPAGAADVEHASGTGLGLWIVSQIVSNAGGAVAVVNPPEHYATCLEVLLPAESDANV